MQLANNLVRWTFREQGLVRLRDPTHRLFSSGATLSQYTINDEVVRWIRAKKKKKGDGAFERE